MRSLLAGALLASVSTGVFAEPEEERKPQYGDQPSTPDITVSPPDGPKAEDGTPLQSFKIQAPTMTEEDQYGYNMPPMYSCEGCRIVLFHLNETMHAKNPKDSKKKNEVCPKGTGNMACEMKKLKKLKSWEYLDIFDNNVCAMDNFDGYGIKMLNDQKNHLSGRALAGEHEQMVDGMGSISMGSDNWKKRLAEECRKLIYDRIGEEETYEMWRQNKLGVNSTAVCYEHKLCKKGADDAAAIAAEKKAKKEAKAAKKKAEKEAKKKAKEAKAKAAPVEKKISLEAYMKKQAAALGKEETYFTKSRGETDWKAAMKEYILALGKKQAEADAEKKPAANDEL